MDNRFQLDLHIYFLSWYRIDSRFAPLHPSLAHWAQMSNSELFEGIIAHCNQVSKIAHSEQKMERNWFLTSVFQTLGLKILAKLLPTKGRIRAAETPSSRVEKDPVWNELKLAIVL